MHGSFGRDNTLNNMAAIGPDFKEGMKIRRLFRIRHNADISVFAGISKYSKKRTDQPRDSGGTEGRGGDGVCGEASPRVEMHGEEPIRSDSGATLYNDEACLTKYRATPRLKECW
jgi:hypothetical protein